MSFPWSRHSARVASKLPVVISAAVAAVACGGTGTTPQDAGVDGPGCGNLTPTPYTITYDDCTPESDAAVDASDASADASDGSPSDASADASDASADAGVVDAADGGRCYASCFEACEANRPPPGAGVASCVNEVSRSGRQVTVKCQLNYLCGRRSEGLVEPSSQVGMGGVLAHAAWLEAASVRSFRRLAHELGRHGAPKELVDAARTAARDEIRHAHAMARLARVRGAEPAKVEATPSRPRTLEEIATENAVEACVGETYGAVVAAWQAERAGDADVREALAAIAPDEAEHAALAWAVHEWLESRLSADANARVRAATRAAIAQLERDLAVAPDAEVARATGLPSAREAAALVAGLKREVWSA